MQNKTIPVNTEIDFDLQKLNVWIASNPEDKGLVFTSAAQFPGGYSNLTFALYTYSQGVYVLRMPPHGAKHIKGGHDMLREFRILTALRQGDFLMAPQPVFACEDESVLGAPFYVMEHVDGHILRANSPELEHITEDTMHSLSRASVQVLADIHAIDIEATGLIHLGKPQGYVQRQVEGWHKRYLTAQTDAIPAVDLVFEFLLKNIPESQAPTFLHNDFKYDNLVLSTNDAGTILAVLDWEMAAIGDPLMDVGTTLAYWSMAEDTALEKQFNFTWRTGNVTRAEWAELYGQKTGRDLSNLSYYYRFGLVKNAVIMQQIYYRWKQGMTTDPRFGALIHGVKTLAEKAVEAVL